MADINQSLEQQFIYCEEIVESLLKDQLGESNNTERNEKLRKSIETLNSLNEAIERLSVFSTNDQIDELPTSSLRYLLVPAYLAYILEEIQVGIGKRKAYLMSSKANYREFLQNLLIFGLINFKLPWNDNEDDGQKGPPSTSLEEAIARRQKKVVRVQQTTQLENALENLRLEERRDNDETAQREIILMLLHLWSIRAVKELDMIEDELKMLDQFEEERNSGSQANSKKEPGVKLKPFIIARNEQQKKVFGLGYPSIPTVTVDEWFDQMQTSGAFGKASTSAGNKMETYTIEGTRKELEEDVDEENEDKRQKKIRMDEWKDMNPRGGGNTYNKG